MKTYTGTAICKYCQREFTWEYFDDGWRPGMAEYVTPCYQTSADPSIALCKHQVNVPMRSEFLISHCPHCQAAVSIPCSERIMKELNEQHLR